MIFSYDLYKYIYRVGKSVKIKWEGKRGRRSRRVRRRRRIKTFDDVIESMERDVGGGGKWEVEIKTKYFIFYASQKFF